MNANDRYFTDPINRKVAALLLAEYVLYLEQKGVIKFTENREQQPTVYGKCHKCDYVNVYPERGCYKCGSPISNGQ